MIRNTCVEAEIGRIPCVVYGRLASALKPKEYIHSISAEELEHLVIPGTTYRKSTAILNRAFHSAPGIGLSGRVLLKIISSQTARR